MISMVCLDENPELESAFNKVFKDKDPFRDIFTEVIKEKVLLFPTEGYFLKQEQYNAILSVISSIGEKEFFISEIEGDCFATSHKDDVYKNGHWVVDLNASYSDYIGLSIFLESALYSKKGNWGVIISHEEHAVLGGDNIFINKFKKYFPDWSRGYQNFLEQWQINHKQYNSNIDWIHNFVKQFQ